MIARSDRHAWREFLLLGLGIIFFYGVLLWAPLIYDDRILILLNPRITGPWGGLRASILLPGEFSEAYEPLVVFFHRFLYALSGERPFLYRLTSLMLHWANAGLVLTLYARYLRDRRLAFLAALLFAVFPAHVEILAGSTFKKHLLVALFTLSTLWLLDRRSWKAWIKVSISWMLFPLALACKESAVILPLLAGAWIFQQRGKDGRPNAVEPVVLFGGWAVILAGYALLRRQAGAPPLHPLAGGTWITHALTSANIFAWYMLHLIAPYPLSLEHSLRPAASAFDGRGWLAVACAAAAFCALIPLYRRNRKAWFGAVWIALALAPFLNLISSLNYSLVAERYLYMASIGFFLLAAIALEKLLTTDSGRRFRPWAGSIMLGIAAAYACGGMRYAATFSDPREVWENAVRRAPRNPRAHAALGSVMRQAGENDAAAEEFRQAIALDPNYPEPYLDLAGVYSNTGREVEAVALAEEGVRLRPDADGWKYLGIYRLKAGLTEPALEALLQAEKLAPADPDIHFDLGFAEYEAHRWGPSRESLLIASQNPRLRARALVGLGMIAEARGQIEQGSALIELALSIDPQIPRFGEGVARIYIALGKKREAVTLYDVMIAGLDRFLSSSGTKPAPELAKLRDDIRLKRRSLFRTRRLILSDESMPIAAPR